MCFLFPDQPPTSVKANGARGQQQQAMLDKQNNPYGFALGLKDAPCKEPVCCCISTLGAPCGLTACWARKAVLEKYGAGVDEYVCCQGYVGKTCCFEPATYCQGSMLGLVLEGCCCPMFSLSIARIHLMDKKQVRPDPCDWQIIQCSNVLQLISCVLDMVAMVFEPARNLAELVGIIVDIFTMSVGGCMGAQVLTLPLPLAYPSPDPSPSPDPYPYPYPYP
jgi:hypothetical protein